MKLSKVISKFSFIFTMLVLTLTLFCFNNNVYAEDTYEADSIYDFLEKYDLGTGYYTVKVNGPTTISYPVHLYTYSGDQTWSQNYTFGDNNDVAQGSSWQAKRMVIIKVKGNLTISSGTITAYSSTISGAVWGDSSQGTQHGGGPKGLTIYVTGTFTNRGTITMTDKGARYPAENVYLYKNPLTNVYQTVPGTGGAGGAATQSAKNTTVSGKPGTNGSGRQTGGGGSGVAKGGSSNTPFSGAGGSGTSYSGGTGGGGVAGGTNNAIAGSSEGGAGGNARRYSSWNAGGGAGNPGGLALGSTGAQGHSGTAGLLTIFAKNYYNYGTVSSTGGAGGQGGTSYHAAGGSGGGGSINIFYSSGLSQGTTNVSGGASTQGYGGAGGSGTVTYTLMESVARLKKIYITTDTEDYERQIEIEDFDPEKFEYEVTLDKYDDRFLISYDTSGYVISSVIGMRNQNGEAYKIEPGESKKTSLTVTSMSGQVSVYNITVHRPEIEEHTSKLKNIDVIGYQETLNYSSGKDLSPIFNPLTTDYTLKMSKKDIKLDIETETYDSEATVSIEGNEYLKEDTGTIIITVKAPEVEDTIYTINYTKIDYTYSRSFSYSNSYTYRIFDTPRDGEYKIELWGAQGGDTSKQGGRGAYTSGKITLNGGEKLYVYPGQSGSSLTSKTFNGGGAAGGAYNSKSGGGATDIRLKSGNWDDEVSLASRIMVAAGGGGADGYESGSEGGYGGALTGGSGAKSNSLTTYTISTGGTQLGGGSGGSGALTGESGSFGKGGSAGAITGSHGGGGGAGYYGGGSGSYNGGIVGSGAGGSSFISGHPGSVAITSEEDISTKKDTNGDDCTVFDSLLNDITCSYHYSEKVFKDTVMYAGNNSSMPTTSGTSTETGHTGNGYAKITMVDVKSNNNYLESLEPNHGTLTPIFDPLEENYTLNVDKYTSYVRLNGRTSDNNAEVSGLDNYEVEPGEEKEIPITVTAENGEIKVYKVKIISEAFGANEHTSKLKRLKIENYNEKLEPEFYSLNEEYEIELLPNELSLKIEAIPFDSEAKVTITGAKLLSNQTDTIEIQVKEPHVEDTIYKITYTKAVIQINEEYDYTGSYQVFTAPYTTKYKLETWGAQGGSYNETYHGGYGAYSKGSINLTKGEKLYIYVGGKGSISKTYNIVVAGGYNGGGTGHTKSYNNDGNANTGGGGGATHIATSLGLLSSFASNTSEVLIVSGGGGGAFYYNDAYRMNVSGDGGGFLGKTAIGYSSKVGNLIASGGTQTGTGNNGAKGSFGQGANYYSGESPGGGGGWYGGNSYTYSGGGGSGYIGNELLTDKKMVMYTTDTNYKSDEENTKTEITQNVSSSPISEYAKSGNGYAKISALFESKDNYLLDITTNKGDVSPDFDPFTEEYEITVGVNDTKIELSARPSSDLAVIEGLGEHDVPGGKTEFPITVTAENGDKRVYKVKVKREKSNEVGLKNIIITGLVPNICSGHVGYCELNKNFNENITDYKMTVPAGIRELEFTVDKKHAYEEVTGDGVSHLSGGKNLITIYVESEDGSNSRQYTYEITRDMTGDNYIDELRIKGNKDDGTQTDEIDIGFSYVVTEYAFKVDNKVTNLDIDIKLDDENASYEIKNNGLLEVGSNIIEIEVTAANGEIRTYTLNVYRLANGNPLLKSLELDDDNSTGNGYKTYMLSPEFKDIVTSYTLNVPNEGNLLYIEAIAQESTTSLTFTGAYRSGAKYGRYELKTGLNVIEIISTAEDGTIETYRILVNREKNSNTYLKSLSAEEGELSPIFDKDIQEYAVTVEAHTKSLNINALPEEETSSVTIEGNSDFKIGENRVTIKVTAEDKSIRYYYIKVTKEGSDNNYLKSLTVSKGEIEPEFDKEVLNYEVALPNEIEYDYVKGEVEDELSSVSGNGNYRILSGRSYVKIKVTSETGKVREYTVHFNRDKNSDASLKELNINNGTLSPVFNSETLEYRVEVDNSISSINVEGIANKETSTVEGNGDYDLKVGENEIIITVTAENGETREYKVIVERKESSNAFLSYLRIKEGKISPYYYYAQPNYTSTVYYGVENVTVLYKTMNSKATVEIEGDKNLKVGENTVTITVTAENGNEMTYYIIVTRQEEASNNLNLKTLDFSGCKIEFNKETQYYECEVAYEQSKTTVKGEAEDEANTVEGNGEYDLSLGENEIIVTVKNNENKEKSYQVIVTRRESSESRLNNLWVSGHSLNRAFNRDVKEYSLTTQERNLYVHYTKLYYKETVKITGNKNLSLGENEITVTVLSADKEHTSEYKIKVTKEKSDNNYLKSLEVEGYEISPEFEKGELEYTITVENEVEKVEVKAEAEDIGSTIEGRGTVYLEKGLNEIKVKVTSESGLERTYTIKITRLGSRNAYLKSLGITGENISPNFNKYLTSYTVTIPYETEEIEVYGEKDEENASVSGLGTIKLGLGEEKTIKVIVTAENGNTRTYRIEIKRKAMITSLLKNIEIKNYKLEEEFQSRTFEYTVIIDNEVTSLNFEITKIDPGSTYIIEGNENLKVGENEIKIISTSSDGNEESIYKIRVIRQAYSNTYLNSLTVTNESTNYELNPSFSKEVLKYEITVPYEVTSVLIGASPENPEVEVTGRGLRWLSVGKNESKVIVTSKGGIKRTYIIEITREKSKEVGIESITSDLGEVIKKDETTYSLEVPKKITKVRSENITVVTKNINAEVEKMDELNLSEDNKYKIIVTSEDESVVKEYTIEISKKKSNDYRIKELKSTKGNLSETFNKNKYIYTLNVDEADEEVEFSVVLNESDAILLTTNLVVELTEETVGKEIQVQAEDGSIGIYKINIVKSMTHKLTLKNISLTGIIDKCETCEVPEYNETTYEYEMTVPYEIKDFDIQIEKNHVGQKVKILKEGREVSNYPLDVGKNEYVVRVENSYGEIQDYTYTINRLRSTNNYLKKLKLTSPEIEIEDFEKTKQEYEVTIPYEYENIEIEAIAEDEENATIEKRGLTYLTAGRINEVKIRVTSASKATREYVIHVLRMPNTNNLLKTLTVSSGDIYTLSPKFKPGITEYTLEVQSSITKVLVEGIADDEEYATVEGNGEYELKVGINKVEIKVTSKEGEERIYKINMIRSSAKNIYLESLEIKNGELEPEFNKEKSLYTVNINYTESALNMEYKPEDPDASVEVRGNENLKYGENIVYIKVISSDNSAAKTYTLKVIKEGNPVNRLLNIKVNDEYIKDFDPEVLSYNLVYEYNVDTATIEVEKAIEAEKIEGEGVHSLEAGKKNEVEITVTAENGDVRIYKINIYRKPNNYLMAIITDRGDISPEFNREILDYEIEVENEIKDITVLGLKEDKDAEVEGNGNYNLKVGENLITLTVTNGEEIRQYRVKVKRKGSDNNYLSNLIIYEGITSPDFDKEINEYEVHIPNTKTKLDMEYEPEDSEAKTEEIGNTGFDEDEEEVIIRVTSTNGTIRDYKIKVIREKPEKFSAKLINLKVSDGILSPKFDSEIYKYSVTVEGIKKITIYAEAEGDYATVEGDGEKELKTGKNVFPITVTSATGAKMTYTVIVFRRDVADARLEELEFDKGTLTPVFNKNTYNYALTIPSEENLLKITKLKPVEEEANIEVIGSLIIEENIENKIQIKVTSKDLSVSNIYTVNIVRETSSNNYLKEININVGKLNPEFDKETNYYEIEVASEVKSINIIGTPESTKSNVSGNDIYELTNKETRVKLIVTAENGNVRVYTIKIVKNESNNNYLKTLEVSGYDLTPTFNKEILEYEISVEKGVNEINIYAEAEDEKATVNGKGIKTVEKNKEYKIEVQAENGAKRIYKIKSIYDTDTSTKIRNLWIEEGVLSPNFSSEIKEYTVVIPNEYDKITEHVELEDSEGSYVIKGNENLKVGANEVEIEVESSKGEKDVYKINVIRSIVASNYLKSLKVSEGELSPEFNKNTLNYEVEVESEIEKIFIEAEAEDSSAIVSGNGLHPLQKGQNIIVVGVTSDTGVTRNYKVFVTRKKSGNNKLLSLGVENYELSPIFNEDILEYEVVTKTGETEVKIIAVGDSEATIEGLGEKEIILGENDFYITVTAENGDIRIYKIKVIRPSEDDVSLINIEPSEGELNPKFDDLLDEYEIKVDENVSIMDIEVTPRSSLAVVSGNKGIILNEMTKEVRVAVTAESGRERTLKFTIKKEQTEKILELDKTVISIVKGEEEEIGITSGQTESDVEKEIENPEVISMEGMKVKGLKKGTTVVTIKLKEQESIYKKVIVNVYSDKLESDVYKIKDKDEQILLCKNCTKEDLSNISIEDYLKNIDNEASMIAVYDKDGNKLLDYDLKVATGMIITLEKDGKEYDRGRVVILGDINGDGMVDTTDKLEVTKHVLSKSELNGYQFYAADTDETDQVDVTDNSKLGERILGKITEF